MTSMRLRGSSTASSRKASSRRSKSSLRDGDMYSGDESSSSSQDLLLSTLNDSYDESCNKSGIVELSKNIVQRRRFAFLVGLVTGVMILLYGASHNDTTLSLMRQHMPYAFRGAEFFDRLSQLVKESQFMDENGESFGLSNWTSLVLERLRLESLSFQSNGNDTDSSAPGRLLAERGLKAHYPVFIIPGIVSTNLESWSRGGCSEVYFRRKIWGDISLMTNLLLDKECYLNNLLLHPVTGLDPDNAKVRAVQGIDAADYFVHGYFVWSRMIENLAYIGYDSNNLHVAAYDWRLSFPNLEKRDAYFSKMKLNIELSLKTTGRKAVLISHSMGGLVAHYFLKWVESRHGGKGKLWVDKHIHAHVSIATPYLGVPKSVSTVLSGEMRDTAQLGWLMSSLLERFFTKKERSAIFRVWSGGSSMLPKGGNAVWGNLTWSAEDTEEMQRNDQSYGAFMKFQDNEDLRLAFKEYGLGELRNFTMDDTLNLLFKHAGPFYRNRMSADYSQGIALSNLESEEYDQEKYFSNPLESSLPKAPNMTIYDFHGYGNVVERSYHYTLTEDNSQAIEILQKFISQDGKSQTQKNQKLTSKDEDRIRKDQEQQRIIMSDYGSNKSVPTEAQQKVPKDFYLDVNANSEDGFVKNGVSCTEGDGTVTLLSLAFMSVNGWRHDTRQKYGKVFNPHKVKVLTREYVHDPVSVVKDIRGGPKTSEHVDILGNHEMTTDILKICAAMEDEVTERIESDIREVADRVELQEFKDAYFQK
ncbi:hypothetical protein MP228_009768 [Amoeboaphelidium protococcarum]|nr:hypothetical protein MP228_009768 [Amoeboaphelidium protococcarum]